MAMQELINSIQDRGLMHAPVVRYMSDDGGKLLSIPTLVAGERRLRAMKEIWDLGGSFKYDGIVIPDGFVPTVSLGELDPLEAEEAELDENLKRKDLTWQEHAAALEKLHKLRVEQRAQEQAREPEATLPAHTVADTAKEVRGTSEGYAQDMVRKELIVAKHLDDPDVAKAKDVKEAFKILKAKEEHRRTAELAKTVGATFTADLHTILNANCLEWMNGQPDGAYDVILTDPPYGMGADSFGDGGGKLTGIDHAYDDSLESWRVLMAAWAPLSYRLAARQAHAYVFCDFDRFHELKGFMEKAGWYVFRTPIVVYKTDSGRVPLPDRGPRRQYELVLYAIKGDKPVTHIYPDVIPSQADQNTGHGAQKPVAVFQNLLQRSVKPGDKVLDTFAGSGPLLPAAHTMQCVATLLEMDPGHYGKILERAKLLKNEEPLPPF